MGKEAVKLFGALSVPLLVMSGCRDEQVPQSGEIIDKEHQTERVWSVPGGPTLRDDEDHILRIDYCGRGESEQCRTVELFVPKNIFERVNLGEYVDFGYGGFPTNDPNEIVK